MKKSKRFICFLMAAAMLLCSIQTAPYTVSAASNDTLGIENGRSYYIKNVASGRYMDVLNGSDYNSQNVMDSAFHGRTSQQWKAVRNSNGTYTFVSVLSTAGRVLNISGTNANIYNPVAGATYQQFTLQRETTGIYYIKNGSQYVSDNASSSNNVYVSPSMSATSSMWSFQAVNKKNVYYFSFNYGDFNTTVPANTIKTQMSAIGYTPSIATNVSAEFGYNCLTNNADVWVFNGHGIEKQSSIQFRSGDGSTLGYITPNSNINNMSANRYIDSLPANALASLRCVLYIGCSTALTNNGYNLVDSTYNRGAHFALGTKQLVYTNETNNWINAFIKKAGEGGTINECKDFANSRQSLGTLYYKGDIHAKFK